MMWRVIISEDDFAALRDHLLSSSDEAAAVLLCGISLVDDGGRLLVRSVVPVPLEGLVYHHSGAVSIKPEWLAILVKEVKGQGLTLVITHSHPFSTTGVQFSSIDTHGQEILIPALQRRILGQPLCELVLGQESVDGLVWESGSETPVPIQEITVIGAKITRLPTTSGPLGLDVPLPTDVYARQSLIWGEVGQCRLRALKVGVVGAGGNGSWVCVQLIHLGVGVIVVVDYDSVESSNRSRVVGSTAEDVVNGTPKVQVVQRYAMHHNPDVLVVPVRAKVESVEARNALKGCDLLIGCTDTYASRDVLNDISIRYLIPLIDTGVEVELENGQLRTFATRCTYVLPGGPCLRCAGFVTQAALDSERDAQRPGYIPGIVSPSVAPLNALAASTAVLDALQLVHGLLGGLRLGEFKAYSGRSGELRRCSMGPSNCTVCKDLYGRGDLEPIFAATRNDNT